MGGFAPLLVTLVSMSLVDEITDIHAAVTSTALSRAFFVSFFFFVALICMNIVMAFVVDVFLSELEKGRDEDLDESDEEEIASLNRVTQELKEDGYSLIISR